MPEALRAPAEPGYRTTDLLLWSGSRTGLLRPDADPPENLDRFRRSFPETPRPNAADLVGLLRRADLRGRGGAGFPAWRKVEAVAARRVDAHDGDRRPVAVVANGEEGEPASCKDRYLLRHRPHLVLEGLDVVRHALDAELAYVYVSDEASRDRVHAAMGERGGAGVEVFLAPRGYVSGEETSVVRALQGGPALPVQKPPRPFEVGVGGRPTAVMNVETLARVAQLWTAHSLGDTASRPADHLLLTVLGPARAVLTEVPLGTTLRTIARHALEIEVPPGTPVLAGGFFSGFLPPEALDVGLGYDTFRALGTGIGCGSFAFLPGHCPVDLATDVMAFFDRENAHQCGSCFKGTAAMHAALSRIGRGRPTEGDVANLERWSRTLVGRGSCGTLDGAAALARSLVTRFADDIARHASTPCPQCAAGAQRASQDTRFRVPVA